MKKLKYSCPECGSENVQIKYWVNPNTNSIIDTAEDEEGWCEQCEQHLSLNIEYVENRLISDFKKLSGK